MDPDVKIMFMPQNKLKVKRDCLKVKLSRDFDRRILPADLEALVETTWADRVRMNATLWNGSKFRIASVDEDENCVTFNLGLTSYKDFIGTNWSPRAQEILKLGKTQHNNSHSFMSDALGVGSLVETSDHFAILLRRSDHCGEAVGYLDIPGGHPEPKELVGNVKVEEIDLEKMSDEAVVNEIFDSTLREICDEVNIPLSSLSDPELLGIARNTTSAGRPSSEYYVRCSLTCKQVESLYRQGSHAEADESTNIVFVPINELLSLHKPKLWNDFAPSAKGCFTLFKLMIDK